MENQIAEAIVKFHDIIPAGVDLVAVSKFHPAEAVIQAYNAGQRKFGESRVQEFLKKIPECPSDVEWHFIGHLQTNKVKQIIGKTSLIESVDSERLLRIIDEESEKAGVVTRVLLQVHVAAEETKFGFSVEEMLAFFSQQHYQTLKATHICGIMGMASNTDDEERVRKDFAAISALYGRIKEISPDLAGFDMISMGMSGDWPVAVEEGATMVRIGTAIFGERVY